MAVRQRRYPKDELAERGQKLYESGIRQQVEVERHPDAQPWIIRIGHRAVYHFGARSLKKNP